MTILFKRRKRIVCIHINEKVQNKHECPLCQKVLSSQWCFCLAVRKIDDPGNEIDLWIS